MSDKARTRLLLRFRLGESDSQRGPHVGTLDIHLGTFVPEDTRMEDLRLDEIFDMLIYSQ